jgi:hypothetical protein
VNAVREVMPGKSNNEIILVLQYYDYNVEKAIQAYVEGMIFDFSSVYFPPFPECYFQRDDYYKHFIPELYQTEEDDIKIEHRK